MAWVWSDDPKEWVTQIGALATGASALFTGIYVWLTLRLVKWTSQTASVALHEARQQRIARLLPVRILLDDLSAQLNALPAKGDIEPSDLGKMSMSFSTFMRDIQVQLIAARTLSPSVYRNVDRLRIAVASVSRVLAEATITRKKITSPVAQIRLAQTVCSELAHFLDSEISAAEG